MDMTMETYRIGHEIPTYNIADGYDCSHWALTDLYKDAEANLRDLINSHKTGEFRTGWCDCKKELQSFRLWFLKDKIVVDVNEWMDDLYEQSELIYDAIWSLYGREFELSEDEENEIKDMCFEADIVDEIVMHKEIKRESTYSDILNAIDELANETSKFLEDEFERVKNVVSCWVEENKHEAI